MREGECNWKKKEKIWIDLEKWNVIGKRGKGLGRFKEAECNWKRREGLDRIGNGNVIGERGERFGLN